MVATYSNNYVDTTNFSDTCYQLSLTVGSGVQTVTVPASPYNLQAVFEYASNSNVFVGCNATPTVPTSGSVNSQHYTEFKPHKRFVKAGDILSFITPDAAAFASVSFRALPSIA